MFIQPDWFDPTQPGVGPDRYSHSGNDPMGRLDPNGNAFFDRFNSQERSDERNQEAADSYNIHVDHLTNQDNADILVRKVGLAGLSADVLDQLVSRVLRRSGFLIHLRSLKAAMNQKSSVVQILKAVPQVLTSDSQFRQVLRG